MSSTRINGDSKAAVYKQANYLNRPHSKPSQVFVVRPTLSSNISPKFQRRIELNAAVLHSYGLKVGDIVVVESKNGTQGFSAAFPSTGQVGGNVALLSSTLRENMGLNLGDSVTIRPCAEKIHGAMQVSVNLRSEQLVSISEKEIAENITKSLAEWRHVYPTMRFSTRAGDEVLDWEVQDVEGEVESDDEDVNGDLGRLSLYNKVFWFLPGTKVAVSSSASEQMQAVTFDSVGGLYDQVKSVRQIIDLSIKHPNLFQRFNISPPRGILLYGPPGTGKTLLLKAVANETGRHILSIEGPSIVGKYQGESEQRLRKIFENAKRLQPSVIFIDELDAIAPKRTADVSEAESRLVATLLTLMDGMEESGNVVVVAATNRPNSIDEALRRPGRFDREIEVGIPDATARRAILQIHLARVPHTLSDNQMQSLADRTHGFVGADLAALCREAAMIAIERSCQNATPVDSQFVTTDDFEMTLGLVRPSAMREIIVEPPKTRWSEIGGQAIVKEILADAVELPLKHPRHFARLGIKPAKGILLYGPPGCSKTLTAKAVATESGLNFIAIRGPEIFSKYLGESERAIRDVFRKARSASPSIVFFDEIDALTSSTGGTEDATNRVLATLLNEMDGIENLVNVIVLAATNKPHSIDAALLRPGRFDKLVYVQPPDEDGRKEIFKITLSKMAVHNDVDIQYLASETNGCSGAEITSLCQNAGLIALKEDINIQSIAGRHFFQALSTLTRQLTPEMLSQYEEFSRHAVR